jgi:hypothetical protein
MFTPHWTVGAMGKTYPHASSHFLPHWTVCSTNADVDTLRCTQQLRSRTCSGSRILLQSVFSIGQTGLQPQVSPVEIENATH